MRIKSYNNFFESRVTNEEFLDKFFRDITGKNKERIQECKSDIDSILFELKKKSDFF